MRNTLDRIFRDMVDLRTLGLPIPRSARVNAMDLFYIAKELDAKCSYPGDGGIDISTPGGRLRLDVDPTVAVGTVYYLQPDDEP